MGERKRQVRAGDQNAWLARGCASREDRHVPLFSARIDSSARRRRRGRLLARLPPDQREAARNGRGGALASGSSASADAWPHSRRNSAAARHGARQKLQIVDFEDALQLSLGVIARGGGAVAVLYHRAGHVHARPSALPGAIADIEILHVGGVVGYVEPPRARSLAAS